MGPSSLPPHASTRATMPVAPVARRPRGVWIEALLAAALAVSIAVTLALALALFASDAQAAPAPAGSNLDNTAASTFVDSATSTSGRSTSNTVRAVTAANTGVTFVPGTPGTADASGRFAIVSRFANNGNTSGVFFARFVELPDSDFVVTDAQMVDDLNNNGVVDAGEPVVTPTTPLTLAPGATHALLMVGTIPVGTPAGAVAKFTLTVQSQDQTFTAATTVTVTAPAAGRVDVTNSATPVAPVQGGNVTFAPEARPVDRPIAGSFVTVDGNGANLVLLRDPVAPNTWLVSATGANGATALYHRRNEPANHYYSTPGNLLDVDAVAFATPSLAPGQTLTGRIVASIATNASGTIANTATLTFAERGVDRSVPSAPVQLTLPTLRSTLQMYGTSQYVRPIRTFIAGNLLYLELNSANCNADADTAETRKVLVTSKLGGGIERTDLLETGPNTGVFRSITPIQIVAIRTGVESDHNNILTVLRDDTILATPIDCGGDAAVPSLLVDPAGVVFDSRSNVPIAGAVVTLIDVTGGGNGGRPGQPAVVYDYDGVSSAPATRTTDGDGKFVFPLVNASTYRLVVVPPPGYTGPSVVRATELPAGHDIEPSGSYGGNFAVTNDLVLLDYPLDAKPVDGLFVEKAASKRLAEIGDYVDYSVTVRNSATVPITAVIVHDQLPRGFAYQRGTLRINGAKAVDPATAAVLDVGVGAIAAGQQVAVSYRLRIGPGATGGDGVNRAFATGGSSFATTRSNTASVKVQLDEGGVFSDRAYLIGKVFADCNGNGVQDPGERGVPDVRIVLEDGTSATTDEDGKYSLYGLIPRTHVAKVDATTLVDGTSLEVLGQRNAGDAGSRFVDLKNGELHRADFALAGCSAATNDAIDQRRGGSRRAGESELAAQALLSSTRVATADPRTLPSSGRLDAKGIVGRTVTASTDAIGTGAPAVAAPGISADAGPSTSDISDRSGSARWPATSDRWPADQAMPPIGAAPAAVAPSAPTPATAPRGVDLATRLPALDDGLGFVDVADGAVLPQQATIRAKGPANAPWTLFVGGRRVDDRRVGERSVVADRNLAAVEYVGVDLAPGVNRLELVAEDAFGNVRQRVGIDVRAAGRLARVVIEAPAEASADGRTAIPVRIRLVDADGVPVTARTPVTLDATQGRWLAKDLDPREAGVQVFVEGGVLDTELLAPADPGRGSLRAATSNLKADAAITFVPELRPLLAVGLVEGVLNLRSLGSNGLVPTQSGDAFEREIGNVTRDFDGGRGSAAARGALYLKGKVAGSTLLTLAYDSDKPQRERLFRDLQPDQFYPVYGDSSVKGFDAQSTSRLYVRVDQGTSYALYGDYTTQTDDPARSLTQYNRALTGAKGRLEEGPVRVDAFAAYTNSQQVVDELPGNGTSGPYTLSRPNGLTNSEQVHVLTRDRNQPAIVIKDVPLSRFADYEIEPFTGRLLFKAPIPSVDADLNPVSIRVTYEVDSGGGNFWVGGVDAKLAIGEQASVGGTYVRDTDPSNRATLRGVNGTVRFAERAVLVGEFAETDSDLYGLGKGRRVEYKHETDDLQARVYGGKTDLSFVNPNALLSQGRTEYGAKVGLRLSDQDRLIFEGLRTEDPATGGRRTGLLARVERSFAGNVKVEVGVRRANETVAPAQSTSLGVAPVDFTSVRTKVTVPVPYLADASVFAEYERAVGAGNRQIAALGGSYVLPSGGKLYARHEFISSLSGAYDLNSTQRLTSTVVGVDADYMKDGHVFNEYRVGGGIDARSAEAAIGLRNLWRIADGVGVTTTAENVKPVGGPVDNRSTALTGAIDYTANPLWKGSARAEYRNATASDSWLVTSGGAFKLSDATTLLGKAIYSNIAGGTTASGGRRLARAQLGAAYRPVDTNVWNALARIEIKREQDGTLAGDASGTGAGPSIAAIDEIATIASAHVNVMPSADLTFAGRYGLKRATDRSNGFESRSTTQMLGGRILKDLNDKWDVGVAAFVLAANGLRSRTYALGLEAGYRVATNLWVSLGYNVSGFKDKDLAGEEYTQRGGYLRMRYKFDENLFATKTPAKDRP